MWPFLVVTAMNVTGGFQHGVSYSVFVFCSTVWPNVSSRRDELRSQGRFCSNHSSTMHRFELDVRQTDGQQHCLCPRSIITRLKWSTHEQPVRSSAGQFRRKRTIRPISVSRRRYCSPATDTQMVPGWRRRHRCNSLRCRGTASRCKQQHSLFILFYYIMSTGGTIRTAFRNRQAEQLLRDPRSRISS